MLLLKSTDFGFSFNVFPVTPNKLLLTKQVFTIVNIVLSDGAQYKCKATDQSGQTIQWPTGSLLFVQAGLYEYNFPVNWGTPYAERPHLKRVPFSMINENKIK